MANLQTRERRARVLNSYSSMDGDDLEAEYKKIQETLEALRNRMRATWNRFPGQTGWGPAIARCERIIKFIAEEGRGQGVING